MAAIYIFSLQCWFQVSFCRDSLANMFFRDEVAGLVLNPRFLGGPRFFLSGSYTAYTDRIL
jgi:hypothetical protein